jgi:hypothetical protein
MENLELNKELDRLLSLTQEELQKNVSEDFNNQLKHVNRLCIKISLYKFLALFILITTIPLVLSSYSIFVVGGILLSLFFVLKVRNIQVEIDLILLFIDMFYINDDKTFG